MNFDDIRPYNADEIPAAMKRIAASEHFEQLARWIFPDQDPEDVRHRVAAYTTVREFQAGVMSKVNERVIAISTTGFSCSGLDMLDANGSYTYVSNHRDIMLDSSLLQYFLLKNGFDTTEITFGANLMSGQLVTDIGKCNKMFRVERPGGSMREFYLKSVHLSEYIRNTVCQNHHSVWIAQRNGRTKNGDDATDQGIIKMFCMSLTSDKARAINELGIVPVSISYEWEPCDYLKALELFASRKGKYTKRPGEDLNSILTGIVQPKGHVHIELCHPITSEDTAALAHLPAGAYHKAIASLIDKRIRTAYRLYPNNFIAHDILHANDKYSSHYTEEQKNAFAHHLDEVKQYDETHADELRNIMLNIYATPIDNKLLCGEI